MLKDLRELYKDIFSPHKRDINEAFDRMAKTIQSYVEKEKKIRKKLKEEEENGRN